MPRATAWQVRMVLSRLRSSTARTSSSRMPTASFGIGLAAGRGDVAAGIVDEDIDRPERARRRLDDPLDVLAFGQVAEHADGAHAVIASPTASRHRRQRGAFAIFGRAVLAHAVNGDVGAEAGEPLGEGAAEPASGAGHQRDLAR